MTAREFRLCQSGCGGDSFPGSMRASRALRTPLGNDLGRGQRASVLPRRSSLFFKAKRTPCGDVSSSLIHPWRPSGENPLDFLTQVLRHTVPASVEIGPVRFPGTHPSREPDQPSPRGPRGSGNVAKSGLKGLTNAEMKLVGIEEVLVRRV